MWQTSSKKCVEVHTARAAQFYFLIQPIRSIFWLCRCLCLRRCFECDLKDLNTESRVCPITKDTHSNEAITRRGNTYNLRSVRDTRLKERHHELSFYFSFCVNILLFDFFSLHDSWDQPVLHDPLTWLLLHFQRTCRGRSCKDELWN